MERQTYVLRSLGVLIPVVMLVAAFLVRYRYNLLPEWARDVYPFAVIVLWPLLALVVALALIYFLDTRMAGASLLIAFCLLMTMEFVHVMLGGVWVSPFSVIALALVLGVITLVRARVERS